LGALFFPQKSTTF